MGLPRDKTGLRQIFPLPREVTQDGVSAICAVGRQLASKLDKVIEQLALMGGEAGVLPGARIIRAVTGAEMLALLLASFPRDHSTIPVGTSATPMSQNLTSTWGAVAVVNNDLAQNLYYGSGTVGVGAGPFIPPQDQATIYVAPGETLYGVVGAASISVGVSNLIVPAT